MLFNHILLGCAAVFCASVATGVMANNGKIKGSQGTMELGGKIIESACAIHPDSHQQRLLLNDIDASKLVKQGHGEFHPFTIRLFNCSSARAKEKPWTAFEITFHGEADGRNFALSGTSKGMALEIIDDRGFNAYPGIPMPAHPVPEGDQMLAYSLRLVGNAELLSAGEHSVSLNYKLDYY